MSKLFTAPKAPTEPAPAIPPASGKVWKTTCVKCGETIRVNFGNLTREEAEAAIDNLEYSPMECPGYHMELTGWRRMWRLDEALATLYPPIPS